MVVEELGRAVAPGPVRADGDRQRHARRGRRRRDQGRARSPGSPTAPPSAPSPSAARSTVADGKASGDAGAVLAAGSPTCCWSRVGDDVAVVGRGRRRDGRDPARTSTPPGARPGSPSTARRARSSPAAARPLVDRNRLLLSAEAMGVALECTELAAAYAKERIQFGRPIAMYQAVKHHCANMCVATELTTSAVWDAAMAASVGADQLSYAAAVAATLAAPAADLCANLNTQVHGGIAITWEHDAHLYMRRATTLLHFIDSEQAAVDLVDLSRRGVVRTKDIKLPPEADAIRDEVRSFAESIKDLSAEEQRDQAHRDRLRHAPLAQAVRPRGRRGRAARDRAGVHRRRGPAPGLRDHRRGTSSRSSSTATRTSSTGGCSRRSTRRSSGASCSASPTPALTRPA